MLFEIALGDAYGASFEFARHDFVEAHNDGISFHTNPVFGAIGNGRYTDDTQMSLALAEIIFKRWEWSADLIYERFFNVFKRDPRPGYSSYFYKVLNSSDTYEEMISRLRPASTGSGAAMRSCPIGVFASIDEIKSRCATQAALTHNTDTGIISSQAVALATHYNLYRVGPTQDLGKWLNDTLGFIDWSKQWTDSVGNDGFDAARASIHIAQTYRYHTEILTQSVALEGDVDTVAAVALGIASTNPYYINDLHPDLYTGLENGAFGQEYLREVDEQLMMIAREQGAPV